ncbi:tripartite motif-containing protein 10-like isoform X3 [Pelodiscus sinensis]|uniref:tripartite motif-containing protein 10-like isoform X3 n=1 Tax=Pelodiscus sinensis TaxID=13735 RepID=UPI003F6D4380
MGHSPPTITISSHHAERSKPKELPAAMAAATPAQEIQEESKCPICLEYLTDPVSTDCGHSFCRGCITQHCETWGKLGSDPLCCPSCKARIQKGSLQSNHQLANIVEKLKQLDLSPGNENLCGRHGRALDLFCEEDWEAVCVVCWRSREHRSHPVLPLDQAAQPHKEKLQAHVATLRERRAKLLRLKETSEQRSQQYLKQTQAKRQKIVAEFQQLRQFLEEQERLLLAQLQKLEEEIRRHQTERGRKLSEQISRLSERIGELEGKCQKPVSEFLQDIRSTLSRCEEGQAQQPEEMAPELEERVRDFSQQTIALSERLRVFKGTLAATLVSGRGYIPANVTLDPDTAHPQLVLSEGGKRVRRAETRQPLPDTPERFDIAFCVLGREGFTSGRHCWEVEVGDGPDWAVGVARESLSRKGWISPEGNVWAVGRYEDQFLAHTDPETPLPQSPPSRIRVCLDCDRGQVTFIDAATEAPIFTFPPDSLPGERIRPWLAAEDTDTELRLCP